MVRPHRSIVSSVQVVADSARIASHAGASLVQGLCDRIGLTDGIRQVFGSHGPLKICRGAVLRDLAVAIADGAHTVVAVEALRSQAVLFGPVASDTTVWRMLGELTEDRRHELGRMIGGARAHVWSDPRVACQLPRSLLVDVDASEVICHTPKEGASGTYKKNFGFMPMICTLDATREVLAVQLRQGWESPKTADCQIAALTAGLAQLPERAFDPAAHQIIVRLDSAGYAHKIVDHLISHSLSFVIGADLTDAVWQQIDEVPESAWKRAIDQDGFERDHAAVCEIPPPPGWGDSVRMIARREIASDGAKLSLVDTEGYRRQVIITNLESDDIAYIAAVYCGRGRAEQVIDELKRCGLGALPGATWEDNQAWICAATLAYNLVRWTQMLALNGHWQTARIDTIRNYLLHTGARITRHAGQQRLHLDPHWPAFTPLTNAFAKLQQMRQQGTPHLQPA